MNKNRNKLFRLILTGILSGMAIILMMLEFPVAIFPTFYQLDFSDLPALVAGVFINPIYGVLVEGIKILLYLLIKPTQTAYIGELANFLIGVSFVLPISLLFKKSNKSLKKLIISLIVGTISISVIGGLLNYFVLIKAYSYFYELPLNTIINMGTNIVPAIKNLFTFVLLATVPFNFLKGLLVSIIFYFVYRSIHCKYCVE